MKKSALIVAVGLGMIVSVGAKSYKNYSRGNKSSKGSSRHSSYKSSKSNSKYSYKSAKKRHSSRKVVVYQPVVKYRKPKVVVVRSSSRYCYPRTTTVYYPRTTTAYYPSYKSKTYRRHRSSGNAASIISSSLNLLGAIIYSANR